MAKSGIPGVHGPSNSQKNRGGIKKVTPASGKVQKVCNSTVTKSFMHNRKIP